MKLNILPGVCLAFALAVTPALAAEPDPALVKQAEAEGHVMWYSSLLEDEAVRPIVEAFNARYPNIKAEYIRMSGSALVKQLKADAAAGKVVADVFDSATAVRSIEPEGMIEPYVPAAAADIPEKYRSAEGLWTAQAMYFLATAYNTDLVAEADVPRSYEDLLDPKWKGKIGWSDSGTASGVGFVGNVLDTMGDEAGMAYLEKLAAQDIVYVKGGGAQALQAVADGEIEIGLSTFTHHKLIQDRKGGPVNFVVFEPSLSFPNPIGLVKGGPHPNAGKLLVEFILSETGQTVLRDSDHIPASTVVPAPDASVNTGFEVNFLTPERAGEVNGRWTEIRDKLFARP